RHELNDLLALTRETDEGHWLQPHREQQADELRTLIFNETTAAIIHGFELSRVPGLFQTEDYARELLSRGLVPEHGVEVLVRARMDRQGLLRRQDPPRLDFFIQEQALRLPIGTRIMQEQLLQLVFLTSLPLCKIRVVPTAVGAHAG